MTPLCCGAFVAACRDELEAPKPGNVHVYAAGHRMTAAQFEDSAAAAAGPLCAHGARVGVRIRGAVAATRRLVGTNTNLGIVLLCAPLAAAAELAAASGRSGGGLRDSLVHVLDRLDVADAADAFAAIVEAGPAGLGRAEQHDVFAPPQVTLKEAMAAAADRDLLARQYATGFAEVFDLGMPIHAAATARGGEAKLATLAVYLGFLSRFPDSHIVRKHGGAAAEEVRRTAQKFNALIREAGDPASLFPQLLAWDASLKAQGLNPGSSADLTVATLFGIRLQSILPSAHISG
ncbi:MAG: triphosphoribosyl-dephospho-CoA synthase [Bradyrhizobiaceae bacterium]|nr:triphosphoribosyl-dephospho-CoA synthase [Bradyrhizobiaceae bacterium]